MPKHSPATRYSLYFVFLISVYFLSSVLQRHETQALFLVYFTLFFAFFWMVKFHSDHVKELLFLGVISRLILFLSIPNLSDDLYRFFWDGMLVSGGINPYNIIPNSIPDLNPELYTKLGSQVTPTTYTPFNQVFFALAYVLGNENVLVSANVIRFFLLGADLVSFYFLRRILLYKSLNPNLGFWFFLNPLVVLEFTGNLHFEGLVIAFLVLSIYFIGKNRSVLAGLFLGLACALKLVPLLMLPFVIFRFRWKKGIIVTGVAMGITLISFIPMLQPAFIEGMESGLRLYFQKFEFNASIYFLVREIGFAIKGYNIIQSAGPVLAYISTLLILITSLYLGIKRSDTSTGWLIALAIFLFLSTTIHPWYTITLIPLGILAGQYWPVAWSLLVFVSYAGYQVQGYDLDMLWLWVEYGLLLIWGILEYLHNTRKLQLD